MKSKVLCPCCGKELEPAESNGLAHFTCKECDLKISIEDPFRKIEVTKENLAVSLTGDDNEPLEAAIHIGLESEDGRVWVKALAQETKWCISNWFSSKAKVITVCYELLNWVKSTSRYERSLDFDKDGCREIIKKLQGIPERSCPYCGKPMIWHLTQTSDYETSFVCSDCKIQLDIDKYKSDICITITDISEKRYSSDPHFGLFTTSERRGDTLDVVPYMPWNDDMSFASSIPKDIGLEEQISITAKLYTELSRICSREGLIDSVIKKLVDVGVRGEAKS